MVHNRGALREALAHKEGGCAGKVMWRVEHSLAVNGELHDCRRDVRVHNRGALREVLAHNEGVLKSSVKLDPSV